MLILDYKGAVAALCLCFLRSDMSIEEQDSKEAVVVLKRSVDDSSIVLNGENTFDQDEIARRVVELFPNGPESQKYGVRKLVSVTPFAWAYSVDLNAQPIPAFDEQILLFSEWCGNRGTEYWYMRLQRNPGSVYTRDAEWNFESQRAISLCNDLHMSVEKPNESRLANYALSTYFGNRHLPKEKLPVKVVSLVDSALLAEALQVSISDEERTRVLGTYYRSIARPLPDHLKNAP